MILLRKGSNVPALVHAPRRFTAVSAVSRTRGTLLRSMTTEERDAKKLRRDQAKVIGTHNGTFHCDEALACFLLKQTPTFHDALIVRTRDSKRLDECDIVVDVGGVYDDGKRRYDHHQRSFQENFGFGYTTKLSSAGLIYKHYGKEIIASKLGVGLDSPILDELWLKLYKEFVEAIDAIDNGIPQYSEDAKPRYRISTDLSSRVSWLNPAWNESVDSDGVDALFNRASTLTGEEFLSRLNYYSSAWLPAREIVKGALSARGSSHPSKHVIVFDQFAPWKEHLFDLEEAEDIADEEKPLYILYPDESASNWRIQAVPIAVDSFESRKALPEEWRGLRDEALSQRSSIPGCIFVHASGFIGGNVTKNGVMAMATAALGARNEVEQNP